MRRLLMTWITLVAVTMSIACAVAPARTTDGALGESAPAPTALREKSITIAVTSSVKGLGAYNIGSVVGGVTSLTEIHSVGLTSGGDNSLIEPRLATQLPTLDDGSIRVLADGTMQTTWKLRPDALWHDGQPFVADDMVFGSQVFLDPDMGLRTPNLAYIDHVEAIDPHTIRIVWKSTFFKALMLGPKEMGPLPTHLLKELYASDKEKFQNHPYWNSEYVQLGPYRLTDFGLGESLTFEAFDRYFLGRPKIDRIHVQVVGDQNALFSRLLARSIDVAAETTLTEELAFNLRDSWKTSGEGRVVFRQGAMDYLVIQFHPDRVALPELSSDVRIRRGLFLGLNREEIKEFIYPGFGDLLANTFLIPGDPRIEIAGRPFERYRFDPQAAVRSFEEAGWRRDAGGKLLRQNGEPATLPIRVNQARVVKLGVLASQLRQLGLTIEEQVTPPALALDREFLSNLQGIEWSMRGGDGLLQYFLTSQLPTPQNRFGGGNRGSYVNPSYDPLVERLYTTVDERDQGRILKEIGEIWASDFPIFPLHYNVQSVALRQGVRTLGDDTYFLDRYAHLWDVN